MISHALTIVANELNAFLADAFSATTPQAKLGNIAEGFASGAGGTGLARDQVYLSIVNLKEEKTLKNVPNYVRNDATLRVSYENPPVFLNFMVLFTSAYSEYTNALLMLSRVIRFFQTRNTFDQDSVAPTSITDGSPVNDADKLETFKLTFDLYSPTMEEVNYLWATLGGKQYPFVLYVLRMLDLKYKAISHESGLITEVVGDFFQKSPV
ncbi:hypothetical protein GMSM_18060 [Geomonas sp. Red276]